MLRSSLLLIMASCASCIISAAEGEKMPLWDGQAPLGDGTTEPAPADATITLHRPAKPNGAALVICPGGGYGMRVSGGEGHGIAAWLNKHNITGVVLDYRLPRGRSAVPLLDAQRAIRLTRAHAKEWNIDMQKIGIVGFSAGGHLAASSATLFESDQANATDPLLRLSSRPDFAILIYPVISMQDGLTHGDSRNNLLGKNPTPELIQRFSTERQVNAETPPCYLAHAIDDGVVSIENSRVFAAAMRTAKRPVELLEPATGNHGFNGYKGPSWDAWQTGSLVWLAELKFIPNADAGQ
jgi:acetyl esterase/lipase